MHAKKKVVRNVHLRPLCDFVQHAEDVLLPASDRSLGENAFRGSMTGIIKPTQGLQTD